ncbi:MAG: SDR family oxidoreductase [Pseudomonadota bacterium]
MTKSAVIVGGSAGVGRAVLSQLMDRGYRVGVIARGHERLTEISEAYGAQVVTRSVDASKSEDIDEAAAELVGELGEPDVWVNCAMATVFAPFRDVTNEEFERVTDVTYLGQVNGARAAFRHMSRGNIVFIGSGLSYRSVPGQSAYCGAKHAINGFVSSVRSELMQENSKLVLSLVQLPAINTPQFDWARSRLSKKPQPAPPIFSPHVAAAGVMRAIDTDAREVIVGRSVLQLIFGNMILPNWLDKKMAESGTEAQKSERPPEDSLDNLMSPAPYPAKAEGSYGDRAEQSGLIIDGDKARCILLMAGLGIPFLLGLILG